MGGLFKVNGLFNNTVLEFLCLSAGLKARQRLGLYGPVLKSKLCLNTVRFILIHQNGMVKFNNNGKKKAACQLN